MSSRLDVINAGTRQAYKLRRHKANSAIQNAELRRSVFARDRSTCVGCGSQKNLVINHIISVYRGGATIQENLQTLCKPCNFKVSP